MHFYALITRVFTPIPRVMADLSKTVSAKTAKKCCTRNSSTFKLVTDYVSCADFFGTVVAAAALCKRRQTDSLASLLARRVQWPRASDPLQK